MFKSILSDWVLVATWVSNSVMLVTVQYLSLRSAKYS